MNTDCGELSQSRVYFYVTKTWVPRLIAWVLSESADGGLNLVPFFYFNAPVQRSFADYALHRQEAWR